MHVHGGRACEHLLVTPTGDASSRADTERSMICTCVERDIQLPISVSWPISYIGRRLHKLELELVEREPANSPALFYSAACFLYRLKSAQT